MTLDLGFFARLYTMATGGEREVVDTIARFGGDATAHGISRLPGKGFLHAGID
jgi:hypothetical protein